MTTTSSPFTYTKQTKRLLEDTPHYIKRMRLTNSVLHVNTDTQKADNLRSRDILFSRPFNTKGPVEILQILSNDSVSGPNYRLDLKCGRFLSFMEQGNHIRAGPATPADAIASVYKFHAMLLKHSLSKFFPDCLNIPNIVATGTLAGPASKTLDLCAVCNSSSKFPGKSITLPTGSTPVLYCQTSNGKDGRNFILPGLVSATQTSQSIAQFSKIVTANYD